MAQLCQAMSVSAPTYFGYQLAGWWGGFTLSDSVCLWFSVSLFVDFQLHGTVALEQA